MCWKISPRYAGRNDKRGALVELARGGALVEMTRGVRVLLTPIFLKWHGVLNSHHPADVLRENLDRQWSQGIAATPVEVGVSTEKKCKIESKFL